jgi:hypothetical protein
MLTCVDRDLAKGQSAIQEVLQNVYKKDSETREKADLAPHWPAVTYKMFIL